MSGRGFLCVAVCATALAGCGGGSGDGAAVETLKEFFAAVDDGDKRKACELLSKGYVEFIEVAESAPCEESLDVSINPEVVKDIEAGRYELTRDRGRVAVRPDNGLGGYELIQEGGEWRVVTPS